MITNEQKKLLKFGFPPETWRQVVLENALDAVIGVNANDEIIDWNIQAEAIFSWSKSEVLGKSLAQIIIPEHQREAHARGMKHFFATGNGPILNRRIEVTALHRSGRTFPVELTVIPILIDGSYIFYSFVRDITDRKLAEQSHKDLQLWSKAVLNQLPVPVILTVLSSGEVVFINEAAIALDLKFPLNAIDFQSCDSYFTDSSGCKIPFAKYPRFRAARGGSGRRP